MAINPIGGMYPNIYTPIATAPVIPSTTPTTNETPETANAIRPIVGEDAMKRLGEKRCETCENRRYQDGSNDPSVSYQTPTKISPEAAAGAVGAHEQQHVQNEQARAKRDDRQVISQSVAIKTSCCPECGRVYVSGGTTRTVTKAKQKPPSELMVEIFKGKRINQKI